MRRLQAWAATLCAAMLGCGGGDDFEVRLRVADAQVERALRHGTVLEVPVDSNRAVEFESNGPPLQVRVEAGAAHVKVVAEEARRYRAVLDAPGGAQVLFVVVLNDVAEGSMRVRVAVQPQRFGAVPRRPGQVLRYRTVIRDLAGTVVSTSEDVERVGAVSASGDYTLVRESRNTPESGSVFDEYFDVDDQYLGFFEFYWITVDGERFDDGSSCRQRWNVTPPAFPLYVGKSWRAVPDGGCGSTETVAHDVLRYESVTAAAGTFPALLRRRTPTDQPLRGASCWWSVELGVNVRCTTRWFGEPPADPPFERGTITRDLVSISG